MGSNGKSLYEYDHETREYKFPDQLEFDKEPYATVIPSRTTTFKVHRSEGLANSALSHHGQGAKYKQENGKWIKVWEFYTPVDCESCSVHLTGADRDNSYWGLRNNGGFFRSPLWKGSAIFAPFLCRNCYDREQAVVVERAAAKRWREEQKRREAFDAAN